MPIEWTRGRLRALLGVITVVTTLLVAGVTWSVVSVLTEGHDDRDDGLHGGHNDDLAAAQAPSSVQERLAARQLPAASLEAAKPGASLSSDRTGTLPVPPPMQVGPAGVATGFPHTPQGALAQLAAIDSTALSSASVRVAQDVITAWAAPGGPTAENWSGVHAVAALSEAARTSGDGTGITVTVEPKMGLIKGTVGEDFVVPCIDFVVTATVANGQPKQVATADCQRMSWQAPDPAAPVGRWVIGAGTEPAAAPSLWPGSQQSFDVGYQWLAVPQQ